MKTPRFISHHTDYARLASTEEAVTVRGRFANDSNPVYTVVIRQSDPITDALDFVTDQVDGVLAVELA